MKSRFDSLTSSLAILLSFLSLFSCHHGGKIIEKKILKKNALDNNYIFIWNKSQSFLGITNASLSKPYAPGPIEIISSDGTLVLGPHNENHLEELFSLISPFKSTKKNHRTATKKQKVSKASTPADFKDSTLKFIYNDEKAQFVASIFPHGEHSELPEFFASPTEEDVKEGLNIKGFESVSPIERINNIQISNVKINDLRASEASSMSINIYNSAVKNVNVTSRLTDFESYSALENYPSLDLALLPHSFMKRSPDSVDHIVISNRKIKSLDIGQKVQNLVITNCYFDKDINLRFFLLDTLVLNDLKFSSGNAIIHLKADNHPLKKIVLLTDRTDLRRMDLDYTIFNYCHEEKPRNGLYQNSWHSQISKNISDIISGQKLTYNIEGIKQAKIDSGKFEDNQKILGFAIVPIKIWWNNYDQDKMQVINATLELFTCVFLINALLFNRIINIYEIDEISKAREKSYDINNRFRRLSYKLCLCLIYSGYIFWGLRLDFSKLKINNLWFVSWIISQYVLGLISLGYIANIIITK
jgi:hypothetical protein